MALRPHADVEPALPRGTPDRLVQVQFVSRPLPREAAQPPQRDLDVAGAQFLLIVQIGAFALFSNLDGALVPALATDPHALGIIAAMAEGGCAAGADPLVAALVTPLLLL